MRCRLLATTALCAAWLFAADPARAEPVTATVASWLVTAGLSKTAAAIVASAALQIGGTVGLSLIGQRLVRRQPDIKRELSVPTSRPSKRWAYGRARIPGTPALRVEGRTLIMGVILNSRPSAGGTVKIYFDGREAMIESGDLYDFDAGGAVLAPVDSDVSFGGSSDRPRAWLGLGGQTKAPDVVVADSEGQIRATDYAGGKTILWLRIGAGSKSSFTERWPNSPPIVEVEADWSLVWDPRDGAQDPDDPGTWAWCNNHGLIMLDAALNNPIRRRQRRLVDIDAFAAAATLADEDVPLYYASVAVGAWPGSPLTVKRYTVNGLLVWSGVELMDQLRPLADAGGGDLVQVGGRLSYVPPVSRAPDYTITDILDEGGLDFARLRPGAELPTAVVASYVAPARGWEEADLPPLPVDAGSSQTLEDGTYELPLPFVTEPTQAMRIAQIARRRFEAQKGLSCMLPPSAIILGPGAIAAWDIPELPKCAGNWRVESINPSLWLQGGGVALRCPVTLAEEPVGVDAWDPETDEIEIVNEVFAPRGSIMAVAPLGTIAAGPIARDPFQ